MKTILELLLPVIASIAIGLLGGVELELHEEHEREVQQIIQQRTVNPCDPNAMD